mgnify:CR=1 FL=1
MGELSVPGAEGSGAEGCTRKFSLEERISFTQTLQGGVIVCLIRCSSSQRGVQWAWGTND